MKSPLLLAPRALTVVSLSLVKHGLFTRGAGCFPTWVKPAVIGKKPVVELHLETKQHAYSITSNKSTPRGHKPRHHLTAKQENVTHMRICPKDCSNPNRARGLRLTPTVWMKLSESWQLQFLRSITSNRHHIVPIPHVW